MTTLSSYIETHFRVIYRHAEATEGDWDTFLLGEDHLDTAMKKANYAFIRAFSDEESTFLVEGISSLSKAKYPEIHFDLKEFPENRSIHLKDSEGNSRVFGWDMDDFLKLDAKREAKRHLSRLFTQLFQESLSLQYAEQSFEVDVEKRLLEQTQLVKIQNHLASNKQETDEWRYKFECISFLEQAIKDGAKEGQEYIDKEIAPIEVERKALKDKLAGINERMDNLMDRLDEGDSVIEEFDQLSDEEKELRDGLSCLVEKMHKLLILKQKEFQGWLWEYTKPDFPSRTCAMVQTLKNIHAVVGLKSKVFGIAGLSHLEEPGNGLPVDDSHSLQSFKDYISQQKNIIVLCPKAKSFPKMITEF